jgi:Zn-dependent protease
MISNLVLQIALLAVPIIIAITFHEAAHAYVANFFGDDTAKRAGRVTLNPIKHIDPFGTILLPLLLLISIGALFGYAKPVPVEGGRLRNPRRDMIFVAAAGAAMNTVLAIVSALLLRSVLNTELAATYDWLPNMLISSIQLNFILAIFNMLPVPPLDGSKVLASLLPYPLARPFMALERFGMVLLLMLLIVLPLVGAQFGMDLSFFSRIVIEPADAATRWIMERFGIAL